MTTITIASVYMTKAAAECVEETRISPASDVARLRSGETFTATLAGARIASDGRTASFVVTV